MCEPVSIGMAALSMVQQQQANAAEASHANAVNAAFEENNRNQLDAYARDMEAYSDEEAAIQEEVFKSAEDAADAQLRAKIEQRTNSATLIASNAEATGAGSATGVALLGNLRRSQLNTIRDLEDNFQRGVTSAKKQVKGLQRDKVRRRFEAMGAINRAPTATSKDQQASLGSIFMAGGSTYINSELNSGRDPLTYRKKPKTPVTNRKRNV